MANEESKSNLDKVEADLGPNYKKEDREVLKEAIDEVSRIASNISNRKSTDINLWPYIKEAVKAMYLSRGAEGLKSRGEGSISNSFDDIIGKLRNDIIKDGMRLMK